MWEPVTLITLVPGVNENGITTKSAEHTREVFGSRESVKRAEYYSALKAGDQPTIAVILWCAEFLEANVTVGENGNVRVYEPTELICGGIRYKIGRAYNKPGSDKIELTCSKIM